MHVKLKVFQSTFSRWKALFAEASDFASCLGPDRLISILRSEDHYEAVIVVWYWNEDAMDNQK